MIAALAALAVLVLLAAGGFRFQVTRRPDGLSRAWRQQHAARPCMECGYRAGRVLHLCGEVGWKSGRVTRWHWNLG